MDRVFKIRRNSDGLYSSGGMYPHFTNRGGKTWSTPGHLKAHVKGVMKIHARRLEYAKGEPPQFVYQGCSVVEVEIVINDKNVLPIEDVETLK